MQYKLSDIASHFDYGLNSAAKDYDGYNKYLRITDIDDSTRIFNFENLKSPSDNLKNKENYLLKNNDIVFARTGASVGKSYLHNGAIENVYFAGFLIRIRVNNLNDSRFIFYNTLTSTYQNFVKITSVRSGQPGINANEYKKYKLYTPKLSEQTKISYTLEKLDKIITLEQEKIRSYLKIKKDLISKLFPIKKEINPNLRFKGYNDNWKQEKLENKISNLKSYPLPRRYETDKESGYRYVHYGDIHTGIANVINDETTLPMIEAGNYETLIKGDLILTDASEDYQGIAWPAILNVSPRDSVLAGLHTIAIRPNDDTDNMFMYYTFLTNSFRKFGYKMGTGMKVFGITRSNILKYEYNFPNEIEEQKKISKIITLLNNIITLEQNRLDQYINIKNTLLQNMLI